MSAESIKAVHEIRLTELAQSDPGKRVLEANLDLIRDVKVRLTASVALRAHGEGAVRPEGERGAGARQRHRDTVDVLLDGRVVARGTLVAAGDSFGVQISEVLAR